MRRFATILLALSVVSAGIALTVRPAEAAPPTFANLNPGGPADLRERVPVNVVFLGYDRRDINRGKLRAGLPREYEPVVRSRLWYGNVEKTGIRYTYDYDVTFADRTYENRFFSQLKRLAKKAPVTDVQQLYNDQVNNALEVTSNYEIPAPAVERWLAENAPEGVNTRENTVYLINWYERKDFRFHVYTKTNEPDPDTGYNFGAERASRKITAWGGTTAKDEENGLGSTRRVWFHDISAGPELWAGSWNVDDADLDGDDEPDYRIPPIWEYGNYRRAGALTADLSRLVRYVAINLLFTTSPLYPVELPTPEPPRTINLDNNTYEGWPGVNASARYIDPQLLTSELQELMAFNRLDYDNQDLPFTGEARRCYEAWNAEVSCYPGLGYPPFANLYLQNTFQLERTKDDRGRVDYELPIFAYATEEDNSLGLLGYADDNYVDGTQSYVFAFVSPGNVESGYGLTTTLIHEVGHHVGLSHPHDGWDSSTGVDYLPTGAYFFAWLGDFSNTMMSYIDLNWDFSQFDHDNLRRFQSAAYIEGANRLAASALAGPNPGRATALLAAADRAVGQAEQAFRRHRYVQAETFALAAYYLARQAAERAGVDVVTVEAPVRANALAARAVRSKPGSIAVDSLETGPRNAR
jgi:hypothetical protein